MTSPDVRPDVQDDGPPTPDEAESVAEVAQPAQDDRQPDPEEAQSVQNGRQPDPDEGPPTAVQETKSSGALSPRLLVPSIVILLAAIATALYFAASSTSHTASSNSPSAAASAPGGSSAVSGASKSGKPTSIPPGGVSGSDALSRLGSSALPLPQELRGAAVKWNSGDGGKDLAAVSGQIGGVLQAGGVRQYVQMRGACVALAATVARAQAGPPIPVAAMQKLYAKSLVDLAGGASSCRAAIAQQPDGDEYVVTTQNQTKLHLAASEFSAGAKDLYRATAEIEAASRQA
jgi:hypothetical protein